MRLPAALVGAVLCAAPSAFAAPSRIDAHEDAPLATAARPGQLGALGSLYGQSVTRLGVQSSTGLALGLFYRRDDVSLVGQLRLADFGDADSFRGAAIQLGARYHFLRGDVTPYIGGGLGLSGFVGRTTDVNLDGGGLGAHAVIGVQMFQTQRISFGASVQADLPFYAFAADPRDSATAPATESSRWAVPIALGLDLILH